jgi:hypothetical protein
MFIKLNSANNNNINVRVNINNITCYYFFFFEELPCYTELYLVGGKAITVKETPEEIDKLIEAALPPKPLEAVQNFKENNYQEINKRKIENSLF